MSHKIRKLASLSLVLGLLAMAGIPTMVLAQGDTFGTGYLGGADLPTSDVREVAINLINIILGLLGILFLVLVLYGGFLWMTAGGADDQAAKGRKIITNGVIGLIIIFVAFALTTFIFNILTDATA